MRGNIYWRQVYVVNETVIDVRVISTYVQLPKQIIRNTVQFGKFEQRGVINRKYCRHQIISTYVDFGTKTAAYTAHRSAAHTAHCALPSPPPEFGSDEIAGSWAQRRTLEIPDCLA